ncbi:MAG: gliding motility protein GldM [Bacteroidia bacterium]|nr:gliding motility protein GldM [Bacteroidia bacterium]
MAQGKLSPRQKMINMMYLVLTALLALNVSKEIINAFVTVNESLVVALDNIDSKNRITYLAFDRAKENDEKKYGPAWTNAQEIKKSAADVTKFIEDLKTDLIVKVEGVEKGETIPELREMGKKDNYDIPTYIMCGDKNDGLGFKATEVKKKMIDFKVNMLKFIDDPQSKANFQSRLDKALDTHDPDSKIVEDGKRTWEMHKFYHNPVVATVALLTKFQTDIKNAESQVIDHILGSIDAKIIKFDVLAPRVIADANYVLIGQDYKADVFLSASSSTLAPDVFVGAKYDSLKQTMSGGSDKPLQVDAGGIAKYTAHPSAEGEQKWGGVIRVKKPDNTYDYYNFSQTFIAAKPTGVVSADKMNVLYIGVDNPMSISVPGVANDRVKTSVSGGGVTLKADSKLGGGHWVATATTQGDATFTVNADFGGKSQVMGTAKYRVKRLPTPIAMLAGSKGGPISKSTLAAQSAIIPVMENFDFELFPRITGFRMSMYPKGKDPIEIDSQDNKLTTKMQDAIRNGRVGDKVYFEYIRGKMPDGTSPSLSGIGFVLQ